MKSIGTNFQSGFMSIQIIFEVIFLENEGAFTKSFVLGFSLPCLGTFIQIRISTIRSNRCSMYIKYRQMNGIVISLQRYFVFQISPSNKLQNKIKSRQCLNFWRTGNSPAKSAPSLNHLQNVATSNFVKNPSASWKVNIFIAPMVELCQSIYALTLRGDVAFF